MSKLVLSVILTLPCLVLAETAVAAMGVYFRDFTVVLVLQFPALVISVIPAAFLNIRKQRRKR